MVPLDLVIVGGGSTGLAGAVQAAAEGLRTTLLERGPLGGRLLRLARVQTVARGRAASRAPATRNRR